MIIKSSSIWRKNMDDKKLFLVHKTCKQHCWCSTFNVFILILCTYTFLPISKADSLKIVFWWCFTLALEMKALMFWPYYNELDPFSVFFLVSFTTVTFLLEDHEYFRIQFADKL